MRLDDKDDDQRLLRALLAVAIALVGLFIIIALLMTSLLYTDLDR